MKHRTVDHCAGASAIPAALRKQIAEAIEAVSLKLGSGVAPKLRVAIIAQLRIRGWSDEVRLSADSDMTITSSKDDVGLCLQTGNMSRVYADLVKLQAMYLDGNIKAAAIILPSQEAAALLGSNVAQARRLERELAIFKKAYHVPTVVYAMEP
jgi:hypothetical protein